MAWAKVQSVNAVVDGSGKITLTLNSVGAGNLLTVPCSYYRLGTGANNATPPAAPTDTNGTMVVAVVPNALNPVVSNDSAGSAIWFEKAAASGTHTVVIGALTGTSWSAHGTMTEWSGGDGTLDKTQSSGSLSATQSRASGTTPALFYSTDLAVVALAQCSGAGVTNAAISDPPTGSSGTYLSLYAMQNTATDQGTEFAYQFLASAAGQSASWTWTDSTTIGSMGVIATFTLVPPISPGGQTALHMLTRKNVLYPI